MVNSKNPRPMFLEAGWYLLNSGGTIMPTQAPRQKSSVDDQVAEPLHDAGELHDSQNNNATELGGQANNDEEEEVSGQGDRIQDRTSDESDHEDGVTTEIPPPTTDPSRGTMVVSASRRQPGARRTNYVARGLFLDPGMAQLVNSPYDPLWIEDNAIDISILDGFTSPIKLEEMFAKGALQLGDVFKAVGSDGMVHMEKVARVSEPCYYNFISTCSKAHSTDLLLSQKPIGFSNGFPSFGIFATRMVPLPQPLQTVDECKGVGALYNALMDQPLPRSMGYRVFEIYRHGQDLGSLFDIRQALHVWLAEKKLVEGQRRRSSAQG